MKRCPVCRADLKGADVCRRCGADLSLLRNIEAAAREHYRKAHEAFLRGDWPAMRLHAREAASKCSIPETRRLLACAALLDADPSSALRIWQDLNASLPPAEAVDAETAST